MFINQLMYTYSLIMLAGWPLIIIAAWFFIRIALRMYERKIQKNAALEEPTTPS